MLIHLWFLPVAILGLAALVALPLSMYLTWIMDGRYTARSFFKFVEQYINTGEQSWQEYIISMLLFSSVLFVFGYVILALQPYLPLNPQNKTLLAPTTIFNSVASFITNTDLQHYSGELHLSNFSQIFFAITNHFISAAIGISAAIAMIRALRGDTNLGNFFVDVWRGTIYILLPFSVIIAIIYLQQGVPMTFKSLETITTLENGTQNIVLGPVAAFEAIKMFGTNGAGFFNTNAAHPFENPTALANFVSIFSMLLIPFALILAYGKMLKHRKHSYVLYIVMFLCLIVSIAWVIYFDALEPNPAFTSHSGVAYKVHKVGDVDQEIKVPEIVGLPVDQHLGNLEGKELRFGAAGAATFNAVTTAVTCGAINSEPDSLNPIAAVAPLLGMWINCIYGGIGVGLINMIIYVVMGIFLAGMMVGRTPEYLGKKIEAREVKLAIISLLFKPLLILLPLGIFAASDWGLSAITNPGAHGLTQMLYQFSSASANNGSAFNGLNIVYGFFNNPNPAPASIAWDLSTGLIIIFSRYMPIIAPIAMAAYLGAKKTSTYGMGTLRIDSITFAILLIGTLIIIGALLFVPVAALGPVAEHFGPMPFGG